MVLKPLMVDLAGREQGQAVSLAELAKSQEITVPYLEQIFSKLKACRLVKSVRGPGGGYLLARGAEHIQILDIIEAVDESLRMTRCEKKSANGCMVNKSRCLTHELWAGLGEHISGYLGSISLADVRNKKNISNAHLS